MVICIGGGLKAIKGVGIVTLLSGLALAIPQLLISVTIGAELPVMVSSIIIMAVIVLIPEPARRRAIRNTRSTSKRTIRKLFPLAKASKQL